MPGRGDINHIRVLRIDYDASDTLGVLKPHQLPGVASIRGFVYTGSDRRAVTGPRLAGADPHRVRVRLIDGDRADRLSVLVEDRLEGRARVERLPHSAP